MANIAIPLAIGLGTSIASALLTPPTEGPRLDDLTFPKSEWGQQIPWFIGRCRLTGNIIAATKLKEKKKTSKSGKGGGGKGGGGFGKQTSYTYTVSLGVLFASGLAGGQPIAGISRIWVNRELKYDVSYAASAKTLTESSKWKNEFLRVYLGSDSQGVDPVLAAVFGNDNTPAYVQRVYITLENYPAEGNITLEAELYSKATSAAGKLTPAAVPLSELVSELSRKVGFTPAEIDVTDLANIGVDGFVVNSGGPAKSSLNQLMAAYAFDAIETGLGVRFQKRVRPAQTWPIVPFEHLAAHAYSEGRPRPFEDRWTDAAPLPREVSLRYINPEANYEFAVARAFRQNAPNSNSQSIDLPVVMPEATAQQVVERYLYDQWISRRRITLKLPPRYLWLEPGDVFQVDLYGSQNELLQAISVTMGANLLCEVEAIPYSGQFPILGGLGGQGRHFEIEKPGPVSLRLLDIPLLKNTDLDNTVYVTCWGDNFKGADLYISRDGGLSYLFLRRLFVETPTGVTLTALPNYSGNLNDDDTTSAVDVQLYAGVLNSISLERFRARENVALIGNEIIWFKDAELLSPNVYRLKTLMRRGRRGTDVHINGHVANERFVLLSDYYEKITLNLADKRPYGGAATNRLKFKAVQPDSSVEDAVAFGLEYEARSLIPYAPIGVTATRVVGGIEFNWVRRDRRGGDFDDYNLLPLSEPREEYYIEIRVSGVVAVAQVVQGAPTFFWARTEAPVTCQIDVYQGGTVFSELQRPRAAVFTI